MVQLICHLIEQETSAENQENVLKILHSIGLLGSTLL